MIIERLMDGFRVKIFYVNDIIIGIALDIGPGYCI